MSTVGDSVADFQSNFPEGKSLSFGVVTVGDEILEGRIVDQHSRTTSALLTPLGVEICWHLSVGDGSGDLRSALLALPSPVDGVVVAGGLGPTVDDRTRQEVAVATGVELEFDEEVWSQIRSRLLSANVQPAENNRNQAYRPQGSDWLFNHWGSAPGFKMSLTDDTLLFALPGVPSEFDSMLKEYILPAIDSHKGECRIGEVLEFIGVPESKLDEWFVAQLGTQGQHHICVKGWGQIEVRLPVGCSLVEDARVAFGPRFLGEGGIGAEAHLVKAALRDHVTISTAESCTGGLIGARITDVPGSSEVYPGGWVCYSYEAKSRELGVDPEILELKGAVSSEVVEAMAAGALERSGSQVAIAVSGIAGPGGGTEEKPIGTVWMAIASNSGIFSHRYQLIGDRTRIRHLTTNLALQVLLAVINKQEIPGWTNQES